MPFRMRFLDWLVVFDKTGNVFCGNGRNDRGYQSNGLEKTDVSQKSIEQFVPDGELYSCCWFGLFCIIMHSNAMATCFAGVAWRMVVPF